MDKIAIEDKFAKFTEHWRPKVVAALNGQEVKLVKVQGVFPWHKHDAAEEMFLVWRGRFRVEYRDRVVDMGPGEMCVVPRGIEHRTIADEEAEVVIQVNGKLRGRMGVPFGTNSAELESRARIDSRVQSYLEGKQVVKVIAVPDKLVNFVVR